MHISHAVGESQYPQWNIVTFPWQVEIKLDNLCEVCYT